MKRSLPASAALVLATAASLLSQQLPSVPSPVPPQATAVHGLPGAIPGTESWIVHFKARGFDLEALRSARHARRPAAEVNTIVADLERRMHADQAPFVLQVEKLGGKVTAQWWIINACAIEIPFAKLAAVQALPNVLRLEPDKEAFPIIKTATNGANHNSDLVNANGFYGKGVCTAIMDTGQDENMGSSNRPHRTYYELGNLNARNRLVLNKALGSMPADDVHGHGTGVAGIAAGGNWGTAGADNGHAPLADIAGYSIANNSAGSSSEVVMAAAWQAIAADAAQYNIVSANNSYSGWSDPLNASQQAMDSCALNADVMICVAAGNSSSSTVNSQSCANGLAVAAVNPTVHTVATFSSRGPLSGDTQRFYPDIAACGVSTVMPQRNNEAANYTASGTSMASPQVCGAATLLRAAVPALTASETKAILLATAMDISRANQTAPYNSRNAYGMGLLRDDSAMTLAQNSQGWGSASVSTTTTTHTFPVIVTAGKTYRACITWMRKDVTSKNWSNLDLEILDGTSVVASSNTPRNLYELVAFKAPRSGSLLFRTTATSLEGTSQPFAWAFTEGTAPPVESEYVVYGTGCPGAPQGCDTCSAKNWTQTLSARTTTAKKIAILEWGYDQLNVCGVELYTNARTAPVDVNVEILEFDNITGAPGKSLGKTSVRIGTTAGVWQANFAQPVRLPPNSVFFVAYDSADSLYLPESTTGSNGLHYEWDGSRWSNILENTRFEYRIRCDKGSQVPVLTGTGKPIVGTRITVGLEKARGNTVALLFVGASDASWGPIQLPWTFVTPCQLLASGDILLGTPTSALGTATIPIDIPNDRTLIGARFFQQYLVADPANALGWIVSNAGRALIGEF